jgi:large subunit ribosomal protein L35
MLGGQQMARAMTKAKGKTKIKTHKGTKKRFRLSAKGKAMHRSSGTSHLAQGVSKKRRRNLRGTTAVDSSMEPTIHAALNGNSN